MADENQEKTYEVKDKRRINPDGTLKEETGEQSAPNPAEETTAEAAAEQAAPETQEPKGPREEKAQQIPEMPPPNIYETLQFLVSLISEQAWQLMGVRLAPGQKEPAKDMAQAKIAIDTVVFIADKLHPHISEEDRKAIRALISDLQMNFVMHG